MSCTKTVLYLPKLYTIYFLFFSDYISYDFQYEVGVTRRVILALILIQAEKLLVSHDLV